MRKGSDNADVSEVDPTAPTAKNEVRCAVLAAWSAYRRWRKRHWSVRVAILVLLVAPDLIFWCDHGKCIPWLVELAARAKLMEGDPQLEWGLYRFNKAREARVLQLALRRALDTDRDGELGRAEQERARSAAGLDLTDLTQPMHRADLSRLLRAAQVLGIRSQSVTPGSVRRAALALALGEARATAPQQREDLEEAVRRGYAWPDYTQPRTWAWGAVFLACPIAQFAFGPLWPGVLMLLCMAVWMGVLQPWCVVRKVAWPLVPAIVAAATFWNGRPVHVWGPGDGVLAPVCSAAGYALLAASAGLCLGRLDARPGGQWLPTACLMLVAGGLVTLAAASAVANDAIVRGLGGAGRSHFPWYVWNEGYGSLVCFPCTAGVLPGQSAFVLCAVGAAFVAGGLWLAFRAPRPRAARPEDPGSGSHVRDSHPLRNDSGGASSR